VVSTFFFMWIAGFTINMMTLMALSLVIGILIDDAVVVRENIFRHMEHGEDPVTAARNGTSEIGLAVMATTFTILAVFLPVGFMTGIVGQFFKSFALTIAFAVSISLLVAFTLDPMLSSRFVRFIPLEERMRTRTGRFMERVGHFYDRIDVQYHKLLGWAVEHPWKIVVTAVVVFVASLSTLSVIGTEFVPAEDRGEFVVNIEAPPGTAFEQTVAHVAEVEKVVRTMPEVRQIFSTVGFEGSPLKASLRVKAGKKHERGRERGLEQLKEDMRGRLKQIPLLKMTVADPEFMQGSPTQAPLSVYLRGDDMDELQRLNEEVVARVKAVPGAVDVDSTLETGQPEMAASVNRELAADLGFDVGSVAMQLRGMVEGIVPTRLREDDKEYDIRVRLAPQFRNDFDTISRTPLYSPTGAVVRARDIVTMQPEVGPAAIEREQRRRQAKINIELSDRPLGDVTADVDKVMQGITMPPNFEWGFAGDVEMMQEAGAAMGLALVLAMAFIYIVLASQFESFLEPFLIMTSLPLALVGALLALLLTGRHIGMPAMIGVVMLMGLVTKNAILLVDLTNQYVRDGLSVKDAILKAGPVRLRPIMMTTIAMILGMLPSAVGTGEGSGFRSPISIATIGGLITSTMLTLVVVPVSYLLLARVVERVKALRSAPARVPQAVRVAGVVLLVALMGWLLSTTSAFAQQAGGGAMSMTFDQALQRALAANEGLKVAQEKVVETQARVQEAKTNFLPVVNLGYSYTPSQRFPTIRIPAGIFGPQEQTFQAAFARENSLQLFINQPIYTGGRLRSVYGITTSSLDASKLELDRTRQEIEYRVVETFYAALMNERGVAVADEQIRLSEKQLELAKARFEAGTVARLDVLQAQVELANAKARRIQTRAQVDASMQALRSVLSLPQTQPLQLNGSLDEPVVGHAREELDQVLPQRPDLRAFNARHDAAEYSSQLAQSEWKPSLSFTGNMQYQQDQVGSLLARDNQSYQFGIAFSMPLFGAPGAAARRSVAQAQMRQAEHGLRYATDNARLELETAWTALEASAEVVTTQEMALELARESVSIAQVSYENGVITSAELNDAQVRLLQTEWLLMQAKYARITAAARAKVAAGIQ